MNRNSVEKTNHTRSGSKMRQWSVMLVGEHGRVIPLRRFKALAIVFLGVFLLLLSGLILLSILYTQQAVSIQSLQSRLQEVQGQAEKLKLERDIHLADLVITREKQTTTGLQPPSIENDGAEELPKKPPLESAAATSDAGKIESTADQSHAPPPTAGKPGDLKNAAEKKKDPPPAAKNGQQSKVTRGARASDVRVGFNHEKKMISLRFKVHNTSQPRASLAGRCVAVFKQGVLPPVDWLALPRVSLIDGKPDGDSGYEFRIKNYMTVELKEIYRQAVADLQTVTIFIFSAEGDELFSQDYPFAIAPAPPMISKRNAESASPSSDPAVAAQVSGPSQPLALQNGIVPSNEIKMASDAQSESDISASDSSPGLADPPVDTRPEAATNAQEPLPLDPEGDTR